MIKTIDKYLSQLRGRKGLIILVVMIIIFSFILLRGRPLSVLNVSMVRIDDPDTRATYYVNDTIAITVVFNPTLGGEAEPICVGWQLGVRMSSETDLTLIAGEYPISRTTSFTQSITVFKLTAVGTLVIRAGMLVEEKKVKEDTTMTTTTYTLPKDKPDPTTTTTPPPPPPPPATTTTIPEYTKPILPVFWVGADPVATEYYNEITITVEGKPVDDETMTTGDFTVQPIYGFEFIGIIGLGCLIFQNIRHRENQQRK